MASELTCQMIQTINGYFVLENTSTPLRLIRFLSKIMNNHTLPEETFIEFIRSEKALWDPNHQHYKDVDTKTKIWRALAEKCNSTGKYLTNP